MDSPIGRRTMLGAALAVGATAAGAGSADAAVLAETIDLTFDAAEYHPGDLMTLTITDNTGLHHSFLVADPAATWTLSGESGIQTMYQATAPADDSQVTVTVVSAAVGYVVNDPPPPPPPVALALVGRSSSNNDHGPLTQCDVVRVYKFGSVVDTELAQSGASALFLSDEPNVQTATALDNALRSLFTRHPDTIVWYMPDNEVTAVQLSASQAAAHNEKLRQMRFVVDEWPNARLGLNWTVYGVRQGRHNILQPSAQWLDFIVSSMYNPGRSNTPPVWDPYPDYVDPVLDAVADWSDAIGRRLAFGTGEYGNPVAPGDPTKRPQYAAGFRQYVHAGCEERDLTHIGDAWWDQQKAGGPNNRLSTDNPLTAQAWKDALL